MSASREKQNRKNAAGTSPKTAREAQQLQEERRSKIMYGSIGAALAAAIILSLLWNSNIISRSANAVTIDGRNYNAAQVSFYYGNAYLSLANSGWASILGLDTSASLDTQYVSSTAAGFLDAVEGESWKEYFLNVAFDQMASVQNGLRQAQEESYVFPDSVQENLEEAVTSLEQAAQTNGVSVNRYLRGTFGAVMTEQVYRTELLRLLQYEAYSGDWTDRLSYTDEEINTQYDENQDEYDLVSYELVTVDGDALLEAQTAGDTVIASATLAGSGDNSGVEIADEDVPQSAAPAATSNTNDATSAVDDESDEDTTDIDDADTTAATSNTDTDDATSDDTAVLAVEELPDDENITPVIPAATSNTTDDADATSETAADDTTDDADDTDVPADTDAVSDDDTDVPADTDTASDESEDDATSESVADTDDVSTDADDAITDTDDAVSDESAAEDTDILQNPEAVEDDETPVEDEAPVEESEALLAARTQAQSILNAWRDEEGSLEDLSADLDGVTYSQQSDGSYSDLTYVSELVQSYLYDPARRSGDVDILENGNTVYVVLFHDRYRDEEPTVDVRHILISPEAGVLTEEEEGYEDELAQLKDEAREEAERILTEWENGDKTEESFAALAEEYSDDNADEGGLYEQIAHNDSYQEAFLDWCFDPARKNGDTGVIETSYGWHVMYFIGQDIPTWEKQVSDTLKDEAYDTWQESLYQDAVVVRHDFGMKFVG